MQYLNIFLHNYCMHIDEKVFPGQQSMYISSIFLQVTTFCTAQFSQQLLAHSKTSTTAKDIKMKFTTCHLHTPRFNTIPQTHTMRGGALTDLLLSTGRPEYISGLRYCTSTNFFVSYTQCPSKVEGQTTNDGSGLSSGLLIL